MITIKTKTYDSYSYAMLAKILETGLQQTTQTCRNNCLKCPYLVACSDVTSALKFLYHKIYDDENNSVPTNSQKSNK